jgi:hypothetical protein
MNLKIVVSPFAFLCSNQQHIIMKAVMKIPGTAAALLLLFSSRLVLTSSTTVIAGEVRRLGSPVEGEDMVSAPRRRQLVSSRNGKGDCDSDACL